MTRKKIHVTAEDIANGTPGNGQYCPVALALKREAINARINVGETYWMYLATVTAGWSDMYGLSETVGRFILGFDYGESVHPFNFFTKVPDAS